MSWTRKESHYLKSSRIVGDSLNTAICTEAEHGLSTRTTIEKVHGPSVMNQHKPYPILNYVPK